MEMPALLKKAENEVRNKIEAMEKRIDDLRKQITNYEADVSALKQEKEKLEKENSKTKAELKKTIDDAFGEARKQIKQREEELEGLRNAIITDKTNAASKSNELAELIKANEKKSVNLDALIKTQGLLNKSIQENKDKFTNASKLIQEALNGQNG